MKAVELWRRFWFEPVDALPLSVFRIGFGLVMLFNLFGQYLPYFHSFYGPNAFIDAQSIYALKWRDLPVFDLMLFLPDTESATYGFLILTMVFAFTFTLGFATRISTIMLFFCILSLNNHCPIILHAGDNFARLVLLFLCFAPSGKYLSLDAVLRGYSSELLEAEPLAMRLVQVQLCFVYLVNWFWKIAGLIWVNGEAVYYATRLTQYYRFDYPVFLDNALSVKVLTWSTLVIELLLVFLIWPKKTRYYFIVIGVMFHLSLDLTFNLGVFEWFFIVTYLLFIEGDIYRKLFSRLCLALNLEKQTEVEGG